MRNSKIGKWSPTEDYKKKLEESKQVLVKEWEALGKETVNDPEIRAQGWRYNDMQTKPVTLPHWGTISFTRPRMKRRMLVRVNTVKAK